MLTKSQLKAATNLKLSDYPDFCIWENSIENQNPFNIWNIWEK